jgi:hypothetical protein
VALALAAGLALGLLHLLNRPDGASPDPGLTPSRAASIEPVTDTNSSQANRKADRRIQVSSLGERSGAPCPLTERPVRPEFFSVKSTMARGSGFRFLDGRLGFSMAEGWSEPGHTEAGGWGLGQGCQPRWNRTTATRLSYTESQSVCLHLRSSLPSLAGMPRVAGAAIHHPLRPND